MAGPRLLLIGGGKMGSALLGGWLEQGVHPGSVAVVEPHEPTAVALRARYPEVRVLDAPNEIEDHEIAASPHPLLVVVAVKPQMLDQALAAYVRFTSPKTVFLSIAAGKTVAALTKALGSDARIVRAMPNTPAAVGRGITVCCPGPGVEADAIRLCDEALSAVGEVAWIDDEALMDPVTAVSGSGPAYVFLLAECLARAGVEAGLPDDLAARLARATVAGAGELLRHSGDGPARLRENVTSPGGTTAEALSVLMAADGMGPLLSRAVAAATRRSRELAG